MRRWLLRLLILLTAVLFAAEGLYLLTANFYLNSERLLAVINRKPGKFSIRWDGGWTVWPGRVHLRNVAMRGSSRRLDWYAHLDTVSVSARIAPLFDRHVLLRRVKVTGVDYRHRRRNATGGVEEPGFPELPEVLAGIPDRAMPTETTAGAGDPRDKESWTIVADDIDAEFNQLWLDRYRMIGSMTLDTSMEMVVRGPLAFPRIHFSMERGDVSVAERIILGGLGFDAQTALPPFGRNAATFREATRHLSGRFRLRADGASLFFLEAYLKKAPWLRFNSQAPLEADLRIDDGRLTPGSTIKSDSDAVSVDLLDRRLTGAGTIGMSVEETQNGPLARLEARLETFSLSMPDGDEPFATGRGFKVIATSPSLSFADMFTTLDVVADLPEAIIPDLSYYNRYIQRDCGIVILGGKGTISYHIEANQDEKSLHGWTDLTATNGALKFQDYEIRGDVKIHTNIRNVDLERKWFDISETTIALHSDTFPWTADIALPRAKALYSEPMQLDADLNFRMTDTAPLVAVFDAKKDISRFSEKLMTVENVKGKATLRLSDRGAEIAGLGVTGEDLLVLADLALREKGKDGILYIKYHVFSVGVAFENGKKDLDLVRARKWFDEQRARRAAAAGAPP